MRSAQGPFHLARLPKRLSSEFKTGQSRLQYCNDRFFLKKTIRCAIYFIIMKKCLSTILNKGCRIF